MPSEWDPHRGTWLAWPHRKSDWPGKFAPIVTVYSEIVKAVSAHEMVNVLVSDEPMRARAESLLQSVRADTANVRFHHCPTDRSWVRDSGPIFAHDPSGGRVALDWHFNAWAKYPDWTNDDRVPAFVAEVCGVHTVRPQRRGWRVVLEGGSIDVNGRGLMLTTEECLLSTTQHRNPPFDRADYEAVFDEYLGVKKVLWLNRGIVGDDTHGHVDDLARFVNPTTVVAVVESDPTDDNYELLQENLDRLHGFTDLDGKKLTVVPLPMPRPVWFDGMRLPASYANFYIANGVVIVPTFNDPADRVALGTLADLFPGRVVVGIHCVDLVWGLGTLHCMTQQEPA
jgi:agmatine deiminase